jgi:hypothetical protein
MKGYEIPNNSIESTDIPNLAFVNLESLSGADRQLSVICDVSADT